jgi:hypothetical protein
MHLQLRSQWNVLLEQCIVTNSESSKLNILVLLITDVVLLLIVLAGLLRMRYQNRITCGIGQLLWKQVR